MQLVLGRVGQGAPAPVRRSWSAAPTSWSAKRSPELVAGMNALAGEPLIDAAALEREIVARDREIDNTFGKDAQIDGDPRGARLSRRPADPRRQAAPVARSGRRAADRRAAARAHPQDARRACRPISPAACCRPTANRCPASMRPAKSRVSAAAACTATARSRGRFSAAAFFPDGRREARRLRR